MEIRNVTRVLPGAFPVTLVRNIQINIQKAEFVAITGPSGSGKSSLLYLMGLLDQPTHGEIFLEGTNTSHLSSSQLASLRLKKLGFVFQFHFLLPEFTVFENVMIPMKKLQAFSPREMKERAREILEELGMGPMIKKKPDQLSGGERQRVAIARALANNPLLILADEPTGNLDSKNAQIVFNIFKKLVEEKKQNVITVTHDPHFSRQTQRQIHIVDGMITPEHATHSTKP
jgi:lipoprotein-releasing system ATP-binding protein